MRPARRQRKDSMRGTARWGEEPQGMSIMMSMRMKRYPGVSMRMRRCLGGVPTRWWGRSHQVPFMIETLD